jgi:hypothetical protein
MTFTLKIKLGNEAMQTGEDIAEALQRIAGKLKYIGYPSSNDYGNIRDVNGNRVGEWKATSR